MKKFLGISGRIIFIILILFFMAFFIGESIERGKIDIFSIPKEIWILTGSFFIMLSGWFISFKNIKLGSIIIVLGGIFNIVYLFIKGGDTNIEAAAVFGAPFIVSGLMIYYSYSRNRKSYY